MNNNIFRHLSGGILALFLVLFCPMSVLAETVPEENLEIAAGGGNTYSGRYDNPGSYKG